jgi:hypothetical protein
MALLTIFLALIFGYGLVSSLLERSVVTAPVVFTHCLSAFPGMKLCSATLTEPTIAALERQPACKP